MIEGGNCTERLTFAKRYYGIASASRLSQSLTHTHEIIRIYQCNHIVVPS
jgi:hypothetical protein